MSRSSLILALAALVLAGCQTRPDWEDDPEAAELDFWFDRPAAVTVVGSDYRTLWDGAVSAGRRFGLEPVISDYRNGVLVYDSADAGSLFEFWNDAQRTPAAWAESTVDQMRRDVRIDLLREGASTWRVEPRVVMQRYSRRTGPVRRSPEEENVNFGWYATGRDVALERSIANRIAKHADAIEIDADEGVLASLRR